MITNFAGPSGYLGIAKQTTPGTAVTPMAAPVFAVGAIVRRKHARAVRTPYGEWVNANAVHGTVIAESLWRDHMTGKQRVVVRWGNGRRTTVLASSLEEVTA